ncbi:DNA adenine methylase [Chitiniphilus shinanonensis]
MRYHGGKWLLAPWIIQHFPEHRVYTEAFGGAGSVLLRKARARLVEVYNDLDGEVVNLFRVLRDPHAAERLAQLLTSTPYARAEFDESYIPADEPVEQARRTVVRSFLGFGSDAASGAMTGFRANGNRQCTHPSRDWINYPSAIQAFTDRLAGVVIECRQAVDIIQQHDAPQTLHYVDPPYVHDTRSAAVTRSGKGYRHEMSDDDHRNLARVLRECAGMVVVSGYSGPLYAELYAGWETSQRSTHADGGLDRVETLWLNPACSQALHARGLFSEIAA